MVDWARFVKTIGTHRRFVLTSHVRPDCDALGSELAMAGVLESLGKEVLICNAFNVPPNLAFIDPKGRLKTLGRDVSAGDLASYDALMVLDTSAWAQLGDMTAVIRAFPGQKMVLDHHVSQDDLGAELFKDVQAEATGRLVVEAAEHLGVELTPEIAYPAFVALATDTGWFRFASAGAGTYRLAAKLIDAGVEPSAAYRELYEQDTLGRLRLIGRTLGKAQAELDGRLIYSWIELTDFAAAGALPPDSEDIINMMLAVGGTQFAVLFVEQRSGGFKISFRSRCDVDCSRLAELHGGGGHRRAAGALLHAPLEEVRSNVLDAVRSAMG
ncbi:MAG: DHH family phosphoesterase [Planctomycetota bacterium]